MWRRDGGMVQSTTVLDCRSSLPAPPFAGDSCWSPRIAAAPDIRFDCGPVASPASWRCCGRDHTRRSVGGTEAERLVCRLKRRDCDRGSGSKRPPAVAWLLPTRGRLLRNPAGHGRERLPSGNRGRRPGQLHGQRRLSSDAVNWASHRRSSRYCASLIHCETARSRAVVHWDFRRIQRCDSVDRFTTSLPADVVDLKMNSHHRVVRK